MISLACALLLASSPTPVSAPDGGSGLREMDADVQQLQAVRDYFARQGDPRKTFAAIAARHFFNALLKRDAALASGMTLQPFFLEAQACRTQATTAAALAQALELHPGAQREFLGLEMLTPAEMVAKYGKPPARLAGVAWNAPNTIIAVANLSGRATIAILKPAPRGMYLVAALTD